MNKTILKLMAIAVGFWLFVILVMALLSLTACKPVVDDEPIINTTTDAGGETIYGEFTERTCINGQCELIIYGEPTFVQDDGEWKRFTELTKLGWSSGGFNFSYGNKYWFILEPYFIYNSNEYTLAQAKGIYPSINYELNKNTYNSYHKFAPSISGIPNAVNNSNLFFGLRLVDSAGIQYSDIERDGNTLTFFHKVRLNLNDLIGEGFTIESINRTHIIIGNISGQMGGNTVVLDPTIELNETNTELPADTYISFNQTNTSPGGNAFLRAGADSSVTNHFVPVIKFITSSITDGATISDATLILHIRTEYTNPDITISPLLLYANFTSFNGASWNDVVSTVGSPACSRDLTNVSIPTSATGNSFSYYYLNRTRYIWETPSLSKTIDATTYGVGDNVTFNLTPLLQRSMDSGEDNFSVILNVTTFSDISEPDATFWEFHSRESTTGAAPMLIVKYLTATTGTLNLTSANNGLLLDTIFDEDGVYDGSATLLTLDDIEDNTGEIGWQKWNISGVPAGATITGARMCVYWVAASTNRFEFFLDTNQTWADNSIDAMCSGGTYCAEVDNRMEVSMKNQTGPGSISYQCFSGFDSGVQYAVNLGIDNMTIVINNSGPNLGSGGFTYFRTIEYVTNVAQIPYFEINYTVGGVGGPDVDTAPEVNHLGIHTTSVPVLDSYNLNGYCNGTDDENSTLNYYWQWYVNSTFNSAGSNRSISNGTNVTTQGIPASSTFPGATWELKCNVDDGRYNSTTLTSTSVTIGVVPVVSDSQILNATPGANADIEGYCKASDSDTSSINYYWQWYVNGTKNAAGTSKSVASGTNLSVGTLVNLTRTGASWQLECGADDSVTNGTKVNSTAKTIGTYAQTTSLCTGVTNIEFNASLGSIVDGVVTIPATNQTTAGCALSVLSTGTATGNVYIKSNATLADANVFCGTTSTLADSVNITSASTWYRIGTVLPGATSTVYCWERRYEDIAAVRYIKLRTALGTI